MNDSRIPVCENRNGPSSFRHIQRGPEGATAHQRPIEVGLIQDNEFVVTKGLEAGTEVVVSNIQKIHDGAAIQPEEPDAAPGPSSER